MQKRTTTANSKTVNHVLSWQKLVSYVYFTIQVFAVSLSFLSVNVECYNTGFSFTLKRRSRVPVTSDNSLVHDDDNFVPMAKYKSSFFHTSPKYNWQLSAEENSEVANKDETSQAITIVEQQMEKLQDQLAYIEALEERNKSQLDSFIDEQDQWDSLEEDERELLQSKTVILNQMDVLAEELIQMWMGQKSMHG